MFIAKDKMGVSNPWLVRFSGDFVWGPKRDQAHPFPTEAQALETGRNAMPSESMKDRVVVEPK